MTLRRLKTQNNFFFSKITLKLEDKIILGIGLMFTISLLCFIGLSNKLFSSFEAHYPSLFYRQLKSKKK